MGQVLIDGQLVFDEDNFLLFRVDAAQEEPLRLGAIASRCLAMLLRSGGTVVRKRELMAGAWGQFGLEVTDNSLAQVVRQLRLALEKLQPEREFIQTLPRIGYKLVDGVRVEDLSSAAKPASIAAAPLVDDAVIATDAPEPVEEESISEAVKPTSSAIPHASPDATSRALPLTPGTSSKRWALGLALPVWGLLAFFLGKLWMTPSTDIPPPAFAAPVTLDEVQVHLPAAVVRSLTPAQLQPMVQRSRKLAGLLGLASTQLHLYLLPTRSAADQILCEGAMESASSRCIGVQQHD